MNCQRSTVFSTGASEEGEDPSQKKTKITIFFC